MSTYESTAPSAKPFLSQSMTVPPNATSFYASSVTADPRKSQITGSPQLEGHQKIIQQNMDKYSHRDTIGGQGQYLASWHSSSPNHIIESIPPNFTNDSVANFSSRGPQRRDSGTSFPIVENVDEDNEDSDSTDAENLSRSILENRLETNQDVSPDNLDELERNHEDRTFLGSYQRVMRPTYIPESDSPFANLGKKSADKALRSTFMPTMLTEEDLQKYPTYVCPRCKTRQREFFTISDAPRALAEPSNYLAFYFGVYVIASLFIFGLEEGWKPLDWYV